MPDVHPGLESTSGAGDAVVSRARVDAPHVLGSPPPQDGTAVTGEAQSTETAPAETQSAEAQAVTAAAQASAAAWHDIVPQVRAQAEQLAAHLRERQQQLDHREAQWNARLAQLDTEVRTARLWWEQRRQELLDRETAVAERELAVAERQAQLDRTEALQDAVAADLEARETEREETRQRLADQAALQRGAHAAIDRLRQETEQRLAQARQQLDMRREASMQMVCLALAGLERRRAAVEERAEMIERFAKEPSAEQRAWDETLTAKAVHLDERERTLEQERTDLLSATSEIESQRRELAAERERLAVQARVDRQQLVDAQRQFAAEMSKKKRALERQAERLDQRRAALEQLRSNLADLHRSTLENRLASEELAVQLSGRVPPAVVTQLLSRLREQLEQQYRDAAGEVATKRAEVEQLREELAADATRLREEKQSLEAWVAERHALLEQQTVRLVAREQQLADTESGDEPFVPAVYVAADTRLPNPGRGSRARAKSL